MKSIFLFLILLDLRSTSWAGKVEMDYQKTQHKGYQHWLKARELMFKNQDSKLEFEMMQVVLTYKTEKKKELIDPEALRSALNHLISNCDEKVVRKINCEESLKLGLSIYKKHWALDISEGTFVRDSEKKLGEYYFRKENYAKALGHYISAIPTSAEYQCENDHNFLLSRIMTLHLKMNNQTALDQAWKWTEFCKKSGKMRENETFVRDDNKKEVVLRTTYTQSEPRKVASKVSLKLRKFTDGNALLTALKDENGKALKALGVSLANTYAEIKKNMTSDQKKAFEDNLRKRESETSKERLDFERIKIKDSKIAERYRLLSVNNIGKVKIGMKRDELIAIFGKPDYPGHPTELEFRLIINEPYESHLTSGAPEGGLNMNTFLFKFSEQGQLVMFETKIVGEELHIVENWFVE